LCIATGGQPRKPNIKGIDLNNVYVLRNSQDQSIIKEKAANAKNIAIIGSSFIGSESASAIKMKYKDDVKVHIIGTEKYPLSKVLGEEIGKMM
jgi:NADPH-dependent 2,4-dienoyl-CoA reductase/sulfur reductase-like enzyme